MDAIGAAVAGLVVGATPPVVEWTAVPVTGATPVAPAPRVIVAGMTVTMPGFCGTYAAQIPVK